MLRPRLILSVPVSAALPADVQITRTAHAALAPSDMSVAASPAVSTHFFTGAPADRSAQQAHRPAQLQHA